MDRVPRSPVVALVATLACALSVAAAEAKPPRSFYGVNQTQLHARDYKAMGAGRVGTLRTPLTWSYFDPTSGPDDLWKPFDNLVAAAARRGVRVLPTVVGTPGWVSDLDGCDRSCSFNPPRTPAALSALREFLRAAVRRYGRGGDFWSGKPRRRRAPIVVWQILNEQNSPAFFAPKPDPGAYAKVVTAASEAIKSEDPKAKVILGGMFGTPAGVSDPDTNAWTYLRRLYREPGVAKKFDGVAVHPYSSSMRGVKFQVRRIRREMKRAGDRRTGLWVTEIGWASSGAKHPYVVGKRGQARKLTSAFRYFTRNRGKLHIRNVDWFRWRDSPKGATTCVWCPKSGLVSRGLRGKPAWRAFKRFTRSARGR